MTITEVDDMLPLTERVMMKRRDGYPFKITNDLGHPSHWRVEIEGQTIGVIVYHRGRKLACHGYTER